MSLAFNTAADFKDLVSDDNTGHSISKELENIIYDCSPAELKMITEIARTVKDVYRR